MRKSLAASPSIVLATLLVVSMSACASASKPKPSDQPGLVIPLPPPHVVSITPEPVVEPVAEAPAPSAPGGTPARNTGRSSVPRPAGDTKPTGTTAEVTTPQLAEVPAPPAGPPPQLRAADSPATEATVRATVDRARRMLATIDYRRLTKERQKAYDDAKRFADQADEALKQGNVVFAQGVAGKAETLARELAAR